MVFDPTGDLHPVNIHIGNFVFNRPDEIRTDFQSLLKIQRKVLKLSVVFLPVCGVVPGPPPVFVSLSSVDRTLELHSADGRRHQHGARLPSRLAVKNCKSQQSCK